MNVREVTCQLIEAAEMGSLSWEAIGRAALTYLSEYDVSEMARMNELLPSEDEMEDEEEIEDEDETEEMKEYLKFLESRNTL